MVQPVTVPVIHDDFDAALDAFLFSRRLKNASDQTLLWYRRRLSLFFPFASQRGETPASLSKETILAYLDERLKKVSPQTANGDLRALKAFCRWMKRERIRDDDPTEGIERLKEPLPYPKTLSDGQIIALFNAIAQGAKRSFAALRDLALFSLLGGWLRGFPLGAGGRSMGRWLVWMVSVLLVGEGASAATLHPARVRLELSIGEKETVGFQVSGEGEARIEWNGPPGEVWREEAFRLIPLRGTLALREQPQRLWLRLDTASLKPGEYRGRLILRTKGGECEANLSIHVWPVHLPQERNFEFEPYYPGIFWLAGGYEATPENLQRLRRHLQRLRELRCTTSIWIFVPWELAWRVRIAQTGQPLIEAAQERPGAIGITAKPRLDFSAYDPFVEEPQRFGLRRLSTYFVFDPAWRVESTCKAITGRPFPPDSDEARSVLVYFYSELARYWREKGYRDVYCKISDEIGPDWVDEYIEQARLVREAGLRPYTTITNWLPFLPDLLRKMNPWCDQWQVGVGYLPYVLHWLRGGYRVVERERVLEGRWVPYTNGGAKETWALSVFPDRPEHPILSPSLTVDGQPLTLLAGPWGNQRRGIFATWGDSVYLSLPDGSNPNEGRHRLVLRYGEPVPEPNAPPLVPLKEGDWILYYGGGSKPFQMSYASCRAFPWNMVLNGVNGYAFWCYGWYPDTERLSWFDEEGNWTPSAAYEGLRDGNEDMALYFAALQRLPSTAERKRLQRRLVGKEGILPVEERVYPWPVNTPITTVAADVPLEAFQRARRILLALLSQRTTPEPKAGTK